MEIIRKVVPNNFNIFLCGDQHIGSVLSSKKLWDQFVEMVNSEFDGIKPEHNYVVDHGDALEAIDVTDIRFDFTSGEETEDGTPVFDVNDSLILRQSKKAIKDRAPIKNNIITILKGNHDHKWLRYGNFVKDVICNDLDVKYGTFSCVIEYMDQGERILFKHYAHHGYGTIRSIAHPAKRRATNKKISLLQKFDSKFGDCLLNSMGHTHQLIICDPEPLLYVTTRDGKIHHEYTKPDKVIGYIEPNHRWYVNTGSFLKTYGLGFDGYGERAGYDPIDLGFAIVKVRNRRVEDIVKVHLN